MGVPPGPAGHRHGRAGPEAQESGHVGAEERGKEEEGSAKLGHCHRV